MPAKSLNQILAENLEALMKSRKISANALGTKAGLSPRTLANYLKTDHNPTATGKERSAKLAEIAKLAQALDVEAIDLLMSMEPEDRKNLKHLRNDIGLSGFPCGTYRVAL